MSKPTELTTFTLQLDQLMRGEAIQRETPELTFVRRLCAVDLARRSRVEASLRARLLSPQKSPSFPPTPMNSPHQNPHPSRLLPTLAFGATMLLLVLFLAWALTNTTPQPAIGDLPTPTPRSAIVYFVQEGDTLQSIANKNGISVESIKEFNHITSDNDLVVGDPIIIGWSTDIMPEPTDDPANGGSVGLTIFETRRDGDGEIYSMNPDGTFQTNLTQNPSEDWSPVWSPDGSKVAFLSDRTGSAQIYIRDLYNNNGTAQMTDYSQITEVTFCETTVDAGLIHFQGFVGLDWSLDGQYLVSSLSMEIDGNMFQPLFLIHTDGSGVVQLTHDGNDINPQWSPLGGQIAFTRLIDCYGETEQDIFSVTMNGQNLYNITHSLEAERSGFSWSPDDTKIAYVSLGQDGKKEIKIANVDGTYQQILVDLGVDRDFGESSLVWSPMGDQLAFISSYLTDEPQIYLINIDGSGLRAITSPPFAYTTLNWSDDGRFLLVSEENSESAPVSQLVFLDLRPVIDSGVDLAPRIETGAEGGNGKIQPTEKTLPDDSAFIDENALQFLQTLTAKYANDILSGSGWLHLQSKQYSDQDPGILGNGDPLPNPSISDDWYQFNEQRQVVQAIHLYMDEDGHINQVSIQRDGQSINLTLGDKSPASPFELNFDFGFAENAANLVAQGATLQMSDFYIDGQSAGIKFNVIADNSSEWEALFDAETGQLKGIVFYQRISTNDKKIINASSILVQEWVDAPPPDILAYLDQEPAPYAPLPPLGTPAPEGFDASYSDLTFKTIFGDDISQPTFFYMDVYAGDYVLGRFDSGGVPGGYCDRSFDGAYLAFNYVGPEPKYLTTLRWFNVNDIANVREPFLSLQQNSPPSFAPHDLRMAFGACEAGNLGNCGYYIYNLPTGELTKITNSPAYIRPAWTPDGNFLAYLLPGGSENTDLKQGEIIRVDTGEVVFTGNTTEILQKYGVAVLTSDSGMGCGLLPNSGQSTAPTLNSDGTYTVKNGDTLVKIASDFGLSAEVLLALNGMTPASPLTVGQVLVVIPPDPHSLQFPSQATVTVPVYESINLRSGPGTQFEMLGTLTGGTPVTVVDANEGFDWFEIEYAESETGTAWVYGPWITFQVQSASASLPADSTVNPALSNLTFKWVFNEDGSAPDIYLGDIYAGDMYIGRADFGEIPGGLCDRSWNGVLIALNYVQGDLATLRWFSLKDVTMFREVPGYDLHSPATFAPNDFRLAFVGCKENDCGIFVKNIETNAPVIKLSDGETAVRPAWSPDGQYVIIWYGPPINANGITNIKVVDADTGEVLYMGDPTLDASPLRAWDIPFMQIPFTSTQRCEAAPDTLSSGPVLPSPDGTYTVQDGDTLAGIANQFGLAIDVLLSLNGLSSDAVLFVGQVLVVAPAVNVGPPAQPALNPDGTYTVQDGDTLSKIAYDFGLTVDTLIALNSLSSEATLIIPGQVLIIVPFDPANLRFPAQAIVKGMVTGKSNLRSGPGTGYEVIDQLDEGDTTIVLEVSENGDWFKVFNGTLSDGTAWIYKDFVTITAEPISEEPQNDVVIANFRRSGDSILADACFTVVDFPDWERWMIWYVITTQEGQPIGGWVVPSVVEYSNLENEVRVYCNAFMLENALSDTGEITPETQFAMSVQTFRPYASPEGGCETYLAWLQPALDTQQIGIQVKCVQDNPGWHLEIVVWPSTMTQEQATTYIYDGEPFVVHGEWTFHFTLGN